MATTDPVTTERGRTDMAAARVFVTEDDKEIYGVMAEFATPADLYHACESVRDAGYRHWDSYTPFPIHGMEEAMGIKHTILPVLVAGTAFTGVAGSYLMQWWMSSDLTVMGSLMKSGKPPGSFGGQGGWQAFVPILFNSAFSSPRSPRSSGCSPSMACPAGITRSSPRNASSR